MQISKRGKSSGASKSKYPLVFSSRRDSRDTVRDVTPFRFVELVYISYMLT